ncbi:hypothetical protein KCP74_19570 [Salmonella enterica subsp. enterica]|nr:hypothetical protein KCP74_19570 [Salmonella enterica subsp. enterica]
MSKPRGDVAWSLVWPCTPFMALTVRCVKDSIQWFNIVGNVFTYCYK